MQKHQLTTVDEVVQHYKNNYPRSGEAGAFYDKMSAQTYEDFCKQLNQNQPENVAKCIGRGQVVDLDPESAEILDIAAGTGYVGQLLKSKGFKNITGLDASRTLLEKLDQNGAYKESRCMYLGQGVDKFPADLKGKFDITTAAGCWLMGHIPAVGMEDCHAALKVGGYMVNCTRSKFWERGEKEGYRDKVEEMIAAGKFQLVHMHEWT